MSRERFEHPRLPYGGRRHSPKIEGEPALRVEGLCVGYDNGEELALTDADLAVHPGERVAMIGHNGAGKSTVLKSVAGLLKPVRGKIRIFGQPVGVCHHRLAYLPQRSDLDWSFPMSVKQLVMTGRYMYMGWLRRPSRQDKKIVLETMGHLGIGDLADRQIGELSGGQQQRTLLARTLAQNADLILLDEPWNAVDNETRIMTEQVICELAEEGRSVVVATHHVERLEQSFDTVAYLSRGRVLRVQPATESLHNVMEMVG